MIHVYYTHAGSARRSQTLERLLSELPPGLAARAHRYRSPEAAFNFVLGRQLLRRALTDHGFDPEMIERIRYNEHDKPLLEGCSFSISHAGYLVACAFSRTEIVGLDVEVLRELHLPDLRSWFTEPEWKDILAAADPRRRLLVYWTKKESVLKAVGGGLSDLDAIRLLDGQTARYETTGTIWHLRELELHKDAVATLCTEGADPVIHLHRLDFP